MPATHMPRGTCDPSIMLRDVPALPPHDTAEFLGGVAVWRRCTGGDNGIEETLCYGLEKHLVVLAAKPLIFRLSLADSSTHNPPASFKGLAILTLCWSYIVSTKLLELQGRRAAYTKACLLPRRAVDYTPRANDYVLDMRGDGGSGGGDTSSGTTATADTGGSYTDGPYTAPEYQT
ncbi:hypothetical protein SPBR_01997 [Sporothrix brasiliensis 5110]|uniref:Uncharacterized protein n=1 Tax=Sporothrix brasiliensis 5110 TaxID=1398154 RepID=A0A0C2IX44_9PEZI|nr:uncharacterized protein SPBR_01997 [Sporothrix brasiliensis 5110]KIH91335.1 hypothetical protein SPBR_01997 [Sporothrix brasiliensis 5110]